MTIWKRTFLIAPGIGVALLPKMACPVCFPLYAGILSALGVGFVPSTVYLFPLTAFFLLIAVGALLFRAERRRGYWPFLLGLGAAGLVLLGKFALESDLVMYGGIGLLLAASIWNSLPRHLTKSSSCPSCVPAGGSVQITRSAQGKVTL